MASYEGSDLPFPVSPSARGLGVIPLPAPVADAVPAAPSTEIRRGTCLPEASPQAAGVDGVRPLIPGIYARLPMPVPLSRPAAIAEVAPEVVAPVVVSDEGGRAR